MSHPILVIGALGNTGAEVVRQLQAHGQAVRAADLNPAAIAERFGQAVEAVRFDFLKPETYPAVLDGVQRLFLIRPPHIGNVKRDMQPFIQAAVPAGVEQVVFLSILEADKLKIVPHHAVEKMLEASGLDYVFLRSAYFMQNLSGIHAPEIRERGEIFIPAGHGTLGMIDVRDVGAVAAQALVEGHRKRAYALTGGEALTFEQAAAQFSRVLGRRIRYSNPSVPHFFQQMRRRKLPTGLVSFMILEYTATKLGRSGKVTRDVEALLGRKPTSFAQFVEDYRSCWT